VLTGANVSRHNGIRHHMDGIRSHSSLAVGFFPDDKVLSCLSYHDLHTTLRDDVMSFEPRGVPVIHSHVYPYFIEWCARHRANRLWVHTYHLPYFAPDGGELEPWEKEINRALTDEARNADVRLSVSRWQQRFLLEEHRIMSDYLPNGVDVALCDEARRERFESHYGTGGFILFVGRNDRAKNPADFVRLAMRLPEQRFLMIGKDLSQASLQQSWGVAAPSNVHFAGEMERGSVQDAIAAATLLVVTSRREGLPTLVLEALAHRKRVVVSDDPGCAEAVSGGDLGFVYRRGDIDDLVAKTQEALASDPVNQAGRDKVLDEYDWRMVAPKLDAIYRLADAHK
jgi:glycosyltransferase involved in cell wall biosynthesis